MRIFAPSNNNINPLNYKAMFVDYQDILRELISFVESVGTSSKSFKDDVRRVIEREAVFPIDNSYIQFGELPYKQLDILASIEKKFTEEEENEEEFDTSLVTYFKISLIAWAGKSSAEYSVVVEVDEVYREVGRGALHFKENSVMDTIIAPLLDARRLKGLSPVELGEMIGATDAAIDNWEKGHQQPPLDKVHEWAKALGYHISLAKDE